ncbi:MAG: prepilin-type N-terminal cleavage/methylation domain-containing protein [Candidatus Omnitrophota bacterium]
MENDISAISGQRTADRKNVEFFSFLNAERSTLNSDYGFTLIEILIVITIIAILATTIIPNFIGFDVEARISATQTNLNSLRTRITLFRAKEGGYPEELEELLTVTYDDMGIKKPYLDRIPPEIISSKKGNNSVENLTSDEEPSGEGGWIYFKDKADVVVNITEPLSSKWGSYAEQKPNEW